MDQEQKKQVHVECSPKTLLRVQNDIEYAKVLTNEIFGNQADADEVVFAAIEDSSTGKTLWREEQVKLLLNLIGQHLKNVGKSCKLKNKTQMWKLISEKLSLEGHIFSMQQVQIKFRSLERQYKKAKMHNAATGRNRISCQFFNELEEILGNHKSISPEYTLVSESIGSVDNLSGDDNDSSDGPSCSKPKRKRFSKVDELVGKLDAIQKERQDFHNTVKQHLEEKKEREARKEERAIKKLELLEKLIQNQNK